MTEVPTRLLPNAVERDEWGQMFRDAYCDQMSDTAEPLDGKAVWKAYRPALTKSAELNWFNEWSALRDRAPTRSNRPSTTVAEIRAQPGYSGIHPRWLR